MAAAAARLSSVKNECVQTNVCTNGGSGLKHRTDQDENKVSWTDWSFYLRLGRMQSNTVFFRHVSSQQSAILFSCYRFDT